jgi:hypothetical protein
MWSASGGDLPVMTNWSVWLMMGKEKGRWVFTHRPL